jgi:hypothetical protein
MPQVIHIDQFLKHNNSYTKDDAYTHSSMGGYVKGKYLIPDDVYNDFLKAYCHSLALPLSTLCIVEKHKDICPIVIDLDFRYNNLERLYNNDLIIDFIEKLAEIIHHYIKIEDEHLKVYVLEKPEPRRVKNDHKDGVHIMIPSIVTKPAYQHKIRQEFLELYSDFFDDVSITAAEDVYDEAVIARNGWLLYGSRKPDEWSSWTLTYIATVDHNCRVLSYEKQENTMKNPKRDEYVRFFSIRKPMTESTYLMDIKPQKHHAPKAIEAQSMVSDASYSQLTSISQAHTTASTATPPSDIKFACDLVDILKPQRANNYDSWIRVGWCLHNIDPDNTILLNKWIEFSRKSYKFTPGECQNIWADMDIRDDNNGLKIGSLIMWARQDNKQAAEAIEKQYRSTTAILHENATVEDIVKSYPRRFSYRLVKAIFEKSHFKVMQPISYVRIYKNEPVMLERIKFREQYRNLYCDITELKSDGTLKYKKVRFVDQWVDDGTIRTYYTMNFYPPPIKCPSDVYNMWPGFAIDKIECESSGNVQPFLDHINVLVNHNKHASDYFIKWLAQLIQQPGKLTGTAPIFVSKEGAGKNRFTESFGDIIGKSFMTETADPKKDLFDRFANGRLNKLMINIDEAKAKDTFAFSEELKNMITSTCFNYEKKNVDPVTVGNFARVMFTSNSDLVVKITASTRRYFVLECSSEKVGDTNYFDSYSEYMSKTQNQKAIIEFLRSVDISSVNWIKDRPITEAYQVMQQQCSDIIVRFIESIYRQMLQTRSNSIIFQASELLTRFEDFIHSQRGGDKLAGSWNQTRFGKRLKDIMSEYPNAIEKTKGVRGKNVFGYVFSRDSVEAMLKKLGVLNEISYMFLDE